MAKKFVVRLTEQELAQMLATSLFDKGFKNVLSSLVPKKSSDNTKINPPSSNADFPNLDLSSSEGYNAYKKIADKFINSRSSNFLDIRGSMLADAARNTQAKTGTYVPVELALAQLAMEGGFSNNPNARPIRTKNPFNVGNVDSGKNVFHSSVQSGIQTYYDTMARKYLTGGKSASDLMKNFVNISGKRYASSPKYERNISQLANQVRDIGEPIYASISKIDSSKDV